MIEDNLADVGHGGEVHHHVAAEHRVCQGVEVAQLADIRLDRVVVVLGLDHVEDHRMVAGIEQLSMTCEPMKPAPPVTTYRRVIVRAGRRSRGR